MPYGLTCNLETVFWFGLDEKELFAQVARVRISISCYTWCLCVYRQFNISVRKRGGLHHFDEACFLCQLAQKPKTIKMQSQKSTYAHGENFPVSKSFSYRLQTATKGNLVSCASWWSVLGCRFEAWDTDPRAWDVPQDWEISQRNNWSQQHL